MSLDGKLKDNATATTNPDPNSLTTTDPYDPTTAAYTNRETASSEWTTQAATNSSALLMRGTAGAMGRDKKLAVAFDPSAGAAVTYTIKVWRYNNLADKWYVGNDESHSLTGYDSILLSDPGWAPIFLEVDTISSGNVDIYFDNGAAQVL